MKAAIASTTGERVDEHFGWATRYYIYNVDETGWRLDQIVPAADGAGWEGAAESDRITARVEAVTGCTLLCVANIGGTAAARVIKARIHPMKLPGQPLVSDTLDMLVTVLRGTPPPWLRKALRPAAPLILEEA